MTKQGFLSHLASGPTHLCLAEPTLLPLPSAARHHSPRTPDPRPVPAAEVLWVAFSSPQLVLRGLGDQPPPLGVGSLLFLLKVERMGGCLPAIGPHAAPRRIIWSRGPRALPSGGPRGCYPEKNCQVLGIWQDAPLHSPLTGVHLQVPNPFCSSGERPKRCRSWGQVFWVGILSPLIGALDRPRLGGSPQGALWACAHAARAAALLTSGQECPGLLPMPPPP